MRRLLLLSRCLVAEQRKRMYSRETDNILRMCAGGMLAWRNYSMYSPYSMTSHSQGMTCVAYHRCCCWDSISSLASFRHLLCVCVLLAHMRTTMQGTVSGLKRGFGYGLGAILGGVLYSSLGPRMCFRVCAALPSLSLLFLVIGSWGNGGRWWDENETAPEAGLEGWGRTNLASGHQRECVSIRRWQTKTTTVPGSTL